MTTDWANQMENCAFQRVYSVAACNLFGHGVGRSLRQRPASTSNRLTGQAMPHDRVSADRTIAVKLLRACIQKHAFAWRTDAQVSRWRNYCCAPRRVRVYGRRPTGPAENNGPCHASDGEGGARSCSLRERPPSPPEGPCGRANAPMRRELWRRMDSLRAAKPTLLAQGG
jgi:hypothetical protein